ncbi:MAG TPA: hypothetical protein VH950_04465 [Gaiellaceae bacterium]|jgi:hypothetical protein
MSPATATTPESRGTTALPSPPRPRVITTAEKAECTCPDFCERDHDRD